MTAIGAMCVTPFRADGNLDEEALPVLVDRQAQAGTTVYLGSYGTGEGHLLRDDEVRRLYAVGVDAARGRVPVVAAALGFTDTARVVEQALEAEALGVDAVQIHPPRPGPAAIVARPAELERYYAEVLEAVRGPVHLTNQVVMVGHALPAELVEELLDTFGEKIVQLNTTDRDASATAALLLRLADRVPVHVGVVDQLLTALALGGAGALCFEAAVAPDLCTGVVGAYRRGDLPGTSAAFERLLRLNAVLARYQNPRSVKAALRCLGLPAGELRRPYLPLAEDEVADLAAELDRLGLGATR